jgi:hypothetical protein
MSETVQVSEKSGREGERTDALPEPCRPGRCVAKDMGK